VVGQLDDADPELLRAVATRLLASGAPLVLLGGRGPDGMAALVARAPGSDFDCGAFLRRVAAAGGGRGGGKPDRAEGRLPAGADWTALVQAALAG
jgi:alanyl-tRNA synthetase